MKSTVVGVSSLAFAIAAWTGASWALTAHPSSPRAPIGKIDVVTRPPAERSTETRARRSSDAEGVALRQEALEKGLDALENVPVPRPSNLADFVKDEKAAIVLGKALFWDQQTGSDGQACASCHFHAGADNRTRNQLTPGFNRVNEDRTSNPDFSFGDADGLLASGAVVTPNFQLVAADYPFHQLEDPDDRESCVDGEDNDGDGRLDFDDLDCFDMNDATSSQGTFDGNFLTVARLNGSVLDRDRCENPLDLHPDDPFQVNGLAIRRVEPRNTPTMINAVFNHRNFWDGRANNIFNGLNPFGERGLLSEPGDPPKGTLFRQDDGTVVKEQVRIDNASLASQAVGPPLSDFEMSCGGRTFADLGRKLRKAHPLNFQAVHAEDSVLARYRDRDGVGLKGTYQDLIKKAFRPELWAGAGRFDANGEPVLSGDGFTQLEVNFPLFFGLAIQLYESTLVSDETPFDDFMKGDVDDLDAVERFGLSTFLNEGNCIACHTGAEFTAASVQERAKQEAIERMLMGDEQAALYDGGFYNIGVRPTSEDLGIGGTILGFPIAFARQITTNNCGPTGTDSCLLDDFAFDPDQFAVDAGVEPQLDERLAVDGAFKVASLRNVDLTGPYFHNGGQATLAQVVAFYDRGGDRIRVECPGGEGDTTGFAAGSEGGNCSNLDPDIQELGLDKIVRVIDGHEVTAAQALVEFLLTLTDDRVRTESAPFDHPQLFVPNGESGGHAYPHDDGTGRAVDKIKEIPATGKSGSEDLETFLGLDPTEE